MVVVKGSGFPFSSVFCLLLPVHHVVIDTASVVISHFLFLEDAPASLLVHGAVSAYVLCVFPLAHLSLFRWCLAISSFTWFVTRSSKSSRLSLLAVMTSPTVIPFSVAISMYLTISMSCRMSPLMYRFFVVPLLRCSTHLVSSSSMRRLKRVWCLVFLEAAFFVATLLCLRCLRCILVCAHF